MVRERVPLAGYTTLRLGGPARRFVEAVTEDELVARVRTCDERGEPLLVLGGGSNLVMADHGFPGTVIRAGTTGLRADAAGALDTGTAAVTVAAGEDWDTVVAWSVSEGLAGLECLSGIPGLAGATPIQNVGAYGQEVAQTITTVRAYDRERGDLAELPAAACGFGYRTSAFKRQAHAAAQAASDVAAHAGAAPAPGFPVAPAGAATGRFVVLAVTFRLRRSALSEPVRYRELAHALGVAEGGRAPLAEVRSAVLALRRAKGMVLDAADPDTRSAGSFFLNPVLSAGQFATLEQTVAATLGPGAAIPRFPSQAGTVKVSAAWLIEHAGFGRGYPGPAGANGAGPRISAKHTLALVNPGGATTASLLALARQVRDGVRDRFGVELVPEPVLVGTAL